MGKRATTERLRQRQRVHVVVRNLSREIATTCRNRDLAFGLHLYSGTIPT
jgi:hypothetical protein